MENTNLRTKINTSGSKDRTLMITLLIIIIIVVLVVVLVIVYRQRKRAQEDAPILIGSPINSYDPSTASLSFTIRQSDLGLEFSYSVWIYVQDWYYRFNNPKCIFVKGNADSPQDINKKASPGLWLEPETNNLRASINTYANTFENTNISNIPLQKWVHIVYVLNNRTVDIYINGKLERSSVLENVPILNDSPLRVSPDGGFMGKISRLQYFRRALKPSEVYNVYQDGPY